MSGFRAKPDAHDNPTITLIIGPSAHRSGERGMEQSSDYRPSPARLNSLMSLAERPLPHIGLDPEALRRLLTRKPVILPAGTGELVKLELGEIDFEWLAEFATRSLCEMIYDESPPFFRGALAPTLRW